MTDPNDTDDGWADLYRELGVESGPAPAKPTAESAHHQPPAAPPVEEPDEDTVPFGAAEDDELEAGYADGPPAGEEDEDYEPAEGDESAEEAGIVAEGDPGETGPKKRRRRRRRRRKKGGEGTEGAPAAAEAEAEEVDFAAEEAAGSDDLPAPESGRELIANWNVPSWEQIVAGLYRPDR